MMLMIEAMQGASDRLCGREGGVRAYPRRLWLVVALWVGLAPAWAAQESRREDENEPLVLAVHPYLSPPEIERRFRPLAAYLSRELGRQVSVRLGRDYDEHIAAVGTNRVDIAFLGPVSYVKIVGSYGAKPLLARFEVVGKPWLHGVIVTRRDSRLRRLADLKGKRVAFGDHESTMSHIVPRAMLAEAGVPVRTLAHYRFLGSHANVALAVLAGDYDAGAVKEEVFNQFASRGLRALAKSPPVADHVFVARADLPAEQVARLRGAMLALKDRPGGAAILEGLHEGMTALVPAADRDYDSLRRFVRTVESESR